MIATVNSNITDDFNPLADVGWYGFAFQLTPCTTQPTWGKGYQLFNVKRMFMANVDSLLKPVV
ncbi:hypothetical protein F4778DRAFT_782683 [Xylariomycetidae sp. FL2044]|nr:hypothetical protein F4778DRAFT_782683 [Xylariomycetidae sp. FL2044]